MLFRSADGGVLDDLIVYRLADRGVAGRSHGGETQTWMVVANAANADVVRDALIDRASGFDAAVDDRSDAYALIALQGPRSQSILEGFTGAPLADLKYYAILAGRVAGIDALVARTGYTGEDGFELYVPAGEAARLWAALIEAGRPEDIRPIGLGARDTLRLEMKYALYGNDIDQTTNPLEAGLG